MVENKVRNAHKIIGRENNRSSDLADENHRTSS